MSDNLQEILEAQGCKETEPMSLYTTMFRLGEGVIQKRNEPKGLRKTNPIMVGNNGTYNIKHIMFEDEFESSLKEFQEYEWAILNGVTYWGKDNIAANQSKMYAMIFDLDGVTKETLNNFFGGVYVDFYPTPNYIVLSGHGVHLYYIFEQPISLYPNIKTQLQKLKYALTKVIWNEKTSTDKTVQIHGINQGYRIAGGKTKIEGIRTRVFEVSTHPVTLDYLNEFVGEEDRIDTSKLYKESTMTLDEAKELFPEWYEKRIVQGKSPDKWIANRKLYEWWKSQMFSDAVYGRRYFCVMALAIFAVKCNVSEEELREDAYRFMKMLNDLNPKEQFTSVDVEAALNCYDERYMTFPRKSLEAITGVSMPERKRNHQDRQTHLQADFWEKDGEIVENLCKKNREAALKSAREKGEVTGRPKGSGTKEDMVRDYFAKHPDSTVRGAAADLKINKGTVQKWKPTGK